MKKSLQITGLLLALLFAFLYLTDYNYILKGIGNTYLRGHTTAFLTDYEFFDNAIVKAASEPKKWPKHQNYNQQELQERYLEYHKKTQTVAFAVLQNDSLVYEKYAENFGPASKSNSFSMVKSMVSALLGKAIMEGAIESVNQKAVDFLPELKGPYAETVTVGDLAAMASGLEWEEKYYSPFSITAASYYVDDINKLVLNQPISNTPNKEFLYLSGSTQLLGAVIERATGEKLATYLSTRFWQPMGAEHDALWQMDSAEKGMVKAYCCLATNALDFARFGKLYKDHGKWEGTQILDSTFIAQSLQPKYANGPEYGYGWWLEQYKGYRTFMMRGHLGQYVIVLPEIDVIVVRLGHLKGDAIADNPFTEDIYMYMDAALDLLGYASKN
jgi:CubicO group peptidase (beta-lactamase class C family)